MITEDELIEYVRRGSMRLGRDPGDMEDLRSNFEARAQAALKARASMPGIGFASVSGRLNCFIAVCRHLDTMIENGDLSLGDAQAVLMIMMIGDRKFRKAAAMFDIRAPRFSIRDRAELPQTAREYLAGLLTYG